MQRYRLTNTFIRATLSALLLGAAACTSDATNPFTGPTDTLSAERGRRGAPGAPLNVQATAGDAKATVTWQPPSSTGSSALIGYKITAAPGGATATVGATTTTATIAGLTNGTSYTFTVITGNSAGGSPASAASNAVTPRAAPPPPAGVRWVTGYYVGYQRSLYPETAVDFTYLTHVVVGAAQPTPTGGVTTDFYVDPVNGPIMARNLSARAHQFGRKAIMMVGGSGAHAAWLAATSPAYRATFVNNLINAMTSLGYDGLDIDWEPIDPSDQPQVLQLLHDLRAARPGMLLTLPVTWTSGDPWYAQVAPLVDQINIMSYQMADNWPGWVSWHSAALYGQGVDHPSSVSNSVTAYLNSGVPAAKLGIGVGAYGSCWQGVSTMLQPLGSNAYVVASDNVMSYATILAQYYTAAAYQWDATAQSGYLGFAAPTGAQQCTMVSYEDPRSVTQKGAYVKGQGLGGAIVWTVGEGHLAAAAPGQQDPLLQAIYTAMQ